jgi:hypothetical protein
MQPSLKKSAIHIILKKYVQTKIEEMCNRHTAIGVSLSSTHGTGAAGIAGTTSYWKVSFDINLPSESENISGLHHYVPPVGRPIHTELACGDTVGCSICLSYKTYQRTQAPHWYCKRNTACHIKVNHQ